MQTKSFSFYVFLFIALFAALGPSNFDELECELKLAHQVVATGELIGHTVRLNFENSTSSTKRIWNIGNSRGDEQFYAVWTSDQDGKIKVSSFGNFAYSRNVPSFSELEPAESMQFELDLNSRGWEPRIGEGNQITAIYYSPGIFPDSIAAGIFLKRLRIDLQE